MVTRMENQMEKTHDMYIVIVLWHRLCCLEA